MQIKTEEIKNERHELMSNESTTFPKKNVKEKN